MNMLPVLLLASAALPAAGDEPPAAEKLHRAFESRLADSPAVSVAYEGELRFRNGEINRTLPYAGAWATRPAGKASALMDGDMHLVTGITVSPSDDPDAEPGFYDFPPNNLFIGPVSRNGFYGDVLHQFLREERGAEEERNGPIAALALSSEQVDAARVLAGGMYFTLNPVDAALLVLGGIAFRFLDVPHAAASKEGPHDD